MPRSAHELTASTVAPQELSSFSKAHIMKHHRQNNPRGGKACVKCAARLGAPRTAYNPANCLSRVIADNIRTRNVACACFGGGAGAGKALGSVAEAVLSGMPPVALLVVDAEGHDDEVLRAYPFERPPARPRRVYFETKHLSRERFRGAAARLAGTGFACLQNCNVTHPSRAQGLWALR